MRSKASLLAPHSLLLLLLLLVGSIPSVAIAVTRATKVQSPRELSGVVTDSNNAVIGSAEVELFRGNNLVQRQLTNANGQYTFRVSDAGIYVLEVSAKGFLRDSRTIKIPLDNNVSLNFKLVVAPITDIEPITKKVGEAELFTTRQATVITSFTPRQVQSSAAQTVDDLLRQVPGFSIFRRSSSLVANPTTQGVSLRGAGASGASRTAVLADGVPLNDAFGGWVYWDRIPREALNLIEVERGGASHLYGSDALSGVISLTSRKANAPTVSASSSLGNLETADASFFAGNSFGKLNLALTGEAFRTDGYFVIAPEARGKSDTRAKSVHRSLSLRLGLDFDPANSVYVRGTLYDQDRNNGTVLQINDTKTESLLVGGNTQTRDRSTWTINLYANQQRYHQDFSAIAADRNTESITRQQYIPSRDVGLRLNWANPTNGQHTLFAGFEVRGVRGSSDEVGFVNNRATSFLSTGGRQRRMGFFFQDYISIGKRWALALSGRFDQWRDSSGASVTSSLTTGAITPIFYQPRSLDAFSPRVAIMFRPTPGVELRAAGYRAFRAPTLNELYRGFRVGNVVTNANVRLTAERLTGGESGISWSMNRRLTSRLTGYYTEIVNPVSNFTVSATPALITRQRRNLGRTRSAGIEAEFESRVTEQLSFSTSYLYSNAIFKRAPQDVLLEGLWIPQVARHQFTLQVSYFNPDVINAAVQFRSSGRQFDDDQNLLPLGSYALIDATISRPLGKYFEVFLAVQNLLDEKFAVARTPIETLGMPRMFRGGIRLNVGQ